MVSLNRTSLVVAIALTLGAAFPPAAAHAEQLTRPHSDKPVCRIGDGASADRHYEMAFVYAHPSFGQAGRRQATVCIATAALEGSVPAQGQLGRIYAHTGYTRLRLPSEPVTPEDAEAAVYWLTKAADQGDAAAAFELGRLYEYGLAGSQDDAQATRLYTQAKAGHDSDAGAALKRVADRADAEKRFMDHYQAAAERGEAPAVMAIVNAYISGDPMRQSYEKAAEWLRRLADAGDSTAQSQLGDMYRVGAGVPRDLNLAVDWLLKASRGRDHRRDFMLVTLYSSKDIDAAHKAAIAQRAAEAGGTPFTEAQAEPQFDPRPDMAAVQAQADKGDEAAQYTVGIFYLGVFGDSVDAAKALPWLIKAADQGEPSAAINLANLYYTGKGVTQDYTAALRWFERAATLGDRRGLYNAAIMYRDGQGATADPAKAYTFGMRVMLDGIGDDAMRGVLGKLRPQIPVEERARCLLRANEMFLAYYFG